MKTPILPALWKQLVRLRRQTFEQFGSARYSRPGLDGLDRRLEEHLNFDGGYFVEAGANDGVSQSNTYYFERFRGWRGLLIEGIPELVAQCRKNRPGATIIQAALVAVADPGKTVEMRYAGLMSTVVGALDEAGGTESHVRRGLEIQHLEATYAVRVPARTLSSILDEHAPARPIDLLSLDVEGAEPDALRGLDFSRHAPRFICVETRDWPAIEAILVPRYRLVEALTHHATYQDLLFALAKGVCSR
jgi:FkbM family methyltransferase